MVDLSLVFHHREAVNRSISLGRNGETDKENEQVEKYWMIIPFMMMVSFSLSIYICILSVMMFAWSHSLLDLLHSSGRYTCHGVLPSWGRPSSSYVQYLGQPHCGERNVHQTSALLFYLLQQLQHHQQQQQQQQANNFGGYTCRAIRADLVLWAPLVWQSHSTNAHKKTSACFYTIGNCLVWSKW